MITLLVVVTAPLKIIEEGVVLAVILPISIVPIAVIVFKVKVPGEAVDFSVIEPLIVVVIEPPVILIALAVIVTALLAPVIRPPPIVNVLVTLMVFPAPTSRVPLVIARVPFTVRGEASVHVSVPVELNDRLL